MQPIVAKYDADRWYSEVTVFVLFEGRSFFYIQTATTPASNQTGGTICTTKYQLT